MQAEPFRRRSLLAVTVALAAWAAPQPDATSQVPPVCVPVPQVDDRCEAWVSVYNHPGGLGTTGIDMAFATQTSLDGELVYVTGQSWEDRTNHYDFATLAYDATTGDQRWLSRWEGPGDMHDIPAALALSPDGKRLYVTGVAHMNPVGEQGDYATVAYDAESGQQLWASTYDGPEAGDDSGIGITLSPDGRWVYVTGKSGLQHSNVDYATIAYRAATGEQAWVARYSSSPESGEDTGVSGVTSNGGEILYVTGTAGFTFGTVAYAAGDRPDAGQELWVARHERGNGFWNALSPDGKRLYVTGAKVGPGSGSLSPNWDYATVAYDAATGSEQWVATYAGLTTGLDVPFDHALSPSGDRIYLTGQSAGLAVELNWDYATVAFDTSTGQLLWASRFGTSPILVEGGTAVTVDPADRKVYVTGLSSTGGNQSDVVTLAYDPATGSQSWIARFNRNHGPPEVDVGDDIAVAPDGSRVFVTGRASYGSDPSDPNNSQPGFNSTDFITLAYEGETPLLADLSVTKTDSRDPVTAKDTVDYQIEVTNNGPDPASNVLLTDTLPPGVTFLSATVSQGTCTEADGVVTCTLGILSRGVKTTMQMQVRATNPGILTNTVSVTGGSRDLNPDNNTDSEETTVRRRTSRRGSIPG